MDVKEVRVDLALNTNLQDDCANYMQNGEMPHVNKDKSYLDIGSHPMGKPDTRPCAIIGPGRVLPTTDIDIHKANSVDPWECSDIYRYPHDSIKMAEYHPTRNISPRQTFQENMQRIMVPPTYSSTKNSDEVCLKNTKINMPFEAKYCDVPYPINLLGSEPKSVRNGDSSMPSINQSLPRSVPPHGWHASVGMRPPKPFLAPEYYQYPEYSSCAGPRPTQIMQTQRILHDDLQQGYPERFYQDSNVRFKPYPTGKERFPQSRYEYVGPNTFHPPAQFPLHKFDIQKSMHSHHYSMYPQVPLKCIDRRYPEPIMDGYQRSVTNQQPNTFHNHPIPSSYGPLPGNCYQNKSYPCPSENSKSMHINKIPYETNNKVYLELENSRSKVYPSPDNFYYNDRAQLVRGDILLSGHPSMNTMAQHQIYKKDSSNTKNYDYHSQYRQRDQPLNISNTLPRLPFQFSPNTIAISPCDSNTSNDTPLINIPQEDCGYASQSSTTSVKSLDSNNGPIDYYKKQMYKTIQNSSQRGNLNTRSSDNTSGKKNLDVRQFLQMWNEGDEGESENNKEVNQNSQSSNSHQEQLYVLGLINVPNEELSKYDHLQKVSKLPENIKGYNNIEILNQYEQLLESPNINHFPVKQSSFKEYKVTPKSFTTKPAKEEMLRPVSPLDVESKISQSVIHKDVGCNFEIKPCSPKLLNVEIATPINNIHRERIIEKGLNPVGMNLGRGNENKIITSVDESRNVTSCKMNHSSFSPNNTVAVKPIYPMQDLGSNMSVCLTSLPQLDNPIELNLPEVNQQFINANKIETSLTNNSDNLPSLDLPNSCFTNIETNCQQNNDTCKQVSPSVSDKETSKLSKYRKTKKSENAIKDFEISSNNLSYVQRTDSVIIKNPENTKGNQNYNSLENGNTINDNIQYQAIGQIINSKSFDSETIAEAAIDFSLNKNESILHNEVNTNNVYNIHSSHANESYTTKRDGNDLSFTSGSHNEIIKIDLNKKESKNIHPSSQNQITNDIQINNLSLDCERVPCNDNIDSIRNKEQLINENLIKKSPHGLPYISDCKGIDSEKDELIKNSVISNNENICTIKHSQSDNVDHLDKLPDLTNEPLIAEHSNINIASTADEVTNNEDEVLNLNLRTILSDEKNNNEGSLTDLDSSSANFDIGILQDSEFTPDFSFPENQSHMVNVNNSKIPEDDNGNNSVFANTLPDSFNEIHHKNFALDMSRHNLHSKKNIANTKKLFFNKEIFSPWIQKLIMYNEGLCKNKEVIDEKYNVHENPNFMFACSDINNKNENFDVETAIGAVKDDVLYKDNTKQNITELNGCILTKDERVEINNEGFFKQFQKNNILTYDINKMTSNNIVDSDNFSFKINESSLIVENMQVNLQTFEITQELKKREDKDLLLHKTENRECLKQEDTFVVESNKFLGGDNDIGSDEMKGTNSNDLLTTSHIELNDLEAIQDYNKSSEENTTMNKGTKEFAINEVNVEKISPCILSEKNYSAEEEIKLDESITTNTYKIEVDSFEVLKQCNDKSNNLDIIDVLVGYKEENVLVDIKEVNSPHSKKETFTNDQFTTKTVEMLVDSPNMLNENINEILTDNEIKRVQETLPPSKPHSPISDILASVTSQDVKGSDFDITESNHNEFVKLKTNSLLENKFPKMLRRTTKRSLSDTALENILEGNDENVYLSKRVKKQKGFVESELIATNLCNILQTHRRNSISEIYNDGNVFILIENDLILTAENEDQKVCITNLESFNDSIEFNEESINSVTITLPHDDKETISTEESWVEDIASIETIFSDDIAENVEIGNQVSPKGSMPFDSESVSNVSSMMCTEVNECIKKVMEIHEENICHNGCTQVESFNETRNIKIKETSVNIEHQIAENELKYRETIKEDTINKEAISNNDDRILADKENLKIDSFLLGNASNCELKLPCNKNKSSPAHPCEYDTEQDPFNKQSKHYLKYSSSPEVTSTTCEDKNSSILLKISNRQGPGLSHIDNNLAIKNKISYKLTEKKNYKPYNPNYSSTGTLITKAAQKYIPPLKITMSDLKVKLPLPPNSLNKLKQLKKSKVQPKIDKKTDKPSNKIVSSEIKKQKPKFEDVLMSIDQIQYKKHKEKKKVKNEIPKVVIKKNESGAHYTSSHSLENNNRHDPDLTGRKWQPWVFIEKNNFIDKMALKNKVKAIYCRRKNTYVLAEKFRKYKSVYNAKFVISQPKSCNLTKGNLKYTIRLKHH